MTYSLKVSPNVDKIIAKLVKKNKKQYEIIAKKIPEILENPHHFKNLHPPLQHLKRIHIDKSFALTFSVDEKTKTITLKDFDHHDNIYKN